MRTDIGPVESQVACWCGSGLQELANAKGNILENKELLDSLNQTKQNSITIVQSLDESVKLQTSLDAVSFSACDFDISQCFQLFTDCIRG